MLQSKPENAEIRDCCLKLLTRREHSRRELLNKLEVKGFGKDKVEKVIDELADEGWQSDTRFAEDFVRLRIRKGHGPVRIAYELGQRGIHSFNQDDCIAEIAGSWMDQIEQVYLKKYHGSQSITRNEWSKRMRFLQQRGFPHDLIQSLYKRLNIVLK